MIPRYTPEKYTQLWSDQHRFEVWLDVELAACEAMESEGVVPQGTAAQLRPLRAQLDAARILEIERETRHDVIAWT